MIIGIGLDIVELDRIDRAWQRHGQRFAQRILCPAELERLPPRTPVAFLAARFAAKEAAVKALGTGFSNGIGPHDIEVRSLPSGQPCIQRHGKAAQRLGEMGATRALISLTHGRDTAAAVVILES